MVATRTLGILIVAMALLGSISIGYWWQQRVPTEGERKLVIGVLPDEEPKRIIEKTTPLEEYLEAKLGVDVKLYGTIDYAALVEAFISKKVDMAWFGGLSYLQAHERAGAIPLVTAAQKGSLFWRTTFLSYPGSGIASMEDLQAKAMSITFAFGDPDSTSGSLMPTYYLEHTWGIDRLKDFKKIIFTGAHDATALAVANKHVEAGAMNNRVFNAMVEKGILKVGEDVVVIWETPEYADYVWAVHPETVSEDLRQRITQAFLEIDDPVVLEVQRATEYVAIDDSYFTDLRSAAIELGFLEVKG